MRLLLDPGSWRIGMTVTADILSPGGSTKSSVNGDASQSDKTTRTTHASKELRLLYKKHHHFGSSVPSAKNNEYLNRAAKEFSGK